MVADRDDPLETVLAAQPRRILGALLAEPSRDADPILRPHEALDGDAYVTLWYELHHVVLPELAADGLVSFDRADGQVRRGPRFDEHVRYSGLLDGAHPDDTPD